MDAQTEQANTTNGWRSYVSLPGVSCLAGSLLLHLYAAQQGKAAAKLESVTGLDRIDGEACPLALGLQGIA